VFAEATTITMGDGKLKSFFGFSQVKWDLTKAACAHHLQSFKLEEENHPECSAKRGIDS
jgi:hypothetical protein